MKTLWLALAGGGLVVASNAATTINPVNAYSYGANFGWIDGRGDTNSGAVIGEYVGSGFIWAANLGWINLGDGSPANGIRYQNNSSADFGVNHDGLGNLTGYAWSANVGWLTFTNVAGNGAFYDGPKVNLFTGVLHGFVWSANCGWISLSNIHAFVQTDTIPLSADTDGDGISDAWEREHFDDLVTANGTSDADGDGASDLDEYLADTDPLDPASALRITHYAANPGGSPATLTWTSRPTRQYRVIKRALVNSGPWSDSGLGLIPPTAGDTTSHPVTDTPSPQRFFRIEAVKPLGP